MLCCVLYCKFIICIGVYLETFVFRASGIRLPHALQFQIQGLSKPNCLKFKVTTEHSLRHWSSLTTLSMIIMRTSRLYQNSTKQTTKREILKRERTECVNMSPFCCSLFTKIQCKKRPSIYILEDPMSIMYICSKMSQASQMHKPSWISRTRGRNGCLTWDKQHPSWGSSTAIRSTTKQDYHTGPMLAPSARVLHHHMSWSRQDLCLVMSSSIPNRSTVVDQNRLTDAITAHGSVSAQQVPSVGWSEWNRGR